MKIWYGWKYGKVDRLWNSDIIPNRPDRRCSGDFCGCKSFFLKSDNIQLLCLHLSLKDDVCSFSDLHLTLANLTLLLYFFKHITNHVFFLPHRLICFLRVTIICTICQSLTWGSISLLFKHICSSRPEKLMLLLKLRD